MADFSAHADRLSAEADTRLGDLIQYAVDGATGADFVPMRGRIFAADPTGVARQWSRTDEAKGNWRLRIAKVLVPNPSKNDRLECAAILGEGIAYRPISKDPIDDGRYWLVDIQKV